MSGAMGKARLAVCLIGALCASGIMATTHASVVTGRQKMGEQKPAEGPKKANSRAVESPTSAKKGEPFDTATPAEMSVQCVTLQTYLGDIVIQIEGTEAPETARNFLNLAATG